MAATLQQLLKTMVESKASDLHITSGVPPMVRIDGKLVGMKHPPLTPPDTKELCYSVLTDVQRQKFEENWELDFSFGIQGLARFRGNVYMQRGCVAGAFRLIPYQIRSLQELGLPPVVGELARKPRGLILVTGPTGSGKTTTLAAIIDQINQERHEHIVTIEDPIEYAFPHKSCVVNQREVGSDTKSFHNALKSVLREDPDVILLGEMRDLETIKIALILSETGHLTLATLHTNTAVQTINRVIDVFPPHEQAQVRAQLSFVLEGILCQTLIPKIGGGRVLGIEVLVPNPAIRNLIREDKVHQIYSQQQLGQEKWQMQTLNQCLANLYLKKLITYEDAISKTQEPEELKRMISGPPTAGRMERMVRQ
ncbi:MAG TPA: type IV pilus twitching motility protein PilT [Thermodesulfobacteriota bacterium]|nr:type IV pilus twitching motility protein PilT [Thermodesulfobacteriota bacterium]